MKYPDYAGYFLINKYGKKPCSYCCFYKASPGLNTMEEKDEIQSEKSRAANTSEEELDSMARFLYDVYKNNPEIVKMVLRKNT